MAINLETSFATVVHTAPSRARLESAFASVVHTAPPRAQLRTAFATVVHGEAGAAVTPDPGFLPRFLSGFFDGVKFE